MHAPIFATRCLSSSAPSEYKEIKAYHATAEAQPTRRTKENLWESMGMAKEDGCMFSGHLESSGCSYAYMAEVVFIQQRHAAVYPAAASCNALHWELLQQQERGLCATTALECAVHSAATRPSAFRITGSV